MAADLHTAAESPWTEDVVGIEVHRYRHGFPRALARRPVRLIDKVAYRWSLLKMRLKYDGSPYDRAIRDQDSFLTLFHQRMAAFEPDVVVVSGAPFNLMYHVAGQREVYRGPLFVADLRDPWIGGQAYGYRNLSERRELAERRKEGAVVKAFDLVSSPWQSVVDDLAARHAGARDKFWWLPHGWDADEIHATTTAPEIDLIYGGNVYRGFEGFLKTLSATARSQNRKVVIHTSQWEEISEVAHDGFEVEALVGSREFYARAATAARLLFLFPESAKDGFPTKVCEYAATGRPIVAVGFAGSLSQLVEDRGLGRFWDMETASKHPEELFGDFPFHPDREWVAGFEFERVTTGFIRKLESRKDKIPDGR